MNVRDAPVLALAVLSAVNTAGETALRHQEGVAYSVLLLVDAACYLVENFIDDEHARARILRDVAAQLDEAAGNSQPH